MTITKYLLSFGKTIEAVQIEKETDKSVWRHGFRIGGGVGPVRRADKRTSYESYHDTWEEAHAEAMKQAERQLLQARAALARAQSHYGNVKGLKDAKRGAA